MNEGIVATIITLLCLVFLGVVTGGFMWGCPHYEVYSQTLSGEAELKKANYTRQIAIQEANAKKESAKLLAEADTIRARGIAGSNSIIGQSLHNNPDYLKYLWIQNIHDGNAKVIYVPTEANLPILEAGNKP